MNDQIQRRVISFALALVGVTVLIGWAAHTAWQEVQDLNEKLTRVQIESFQTAEQFRAGLEGLNYCLLRFEIRHDPADWEEFLRLSKRLDRWIDEQPPKMSTPRERKMLDAINTTYDDYLAAARALEKLDPAEAAETRLAKFARVEQTSQLMLSLEGVLFKAHHASLTQFLEASRRSLDLLRGLTFGALFFLLVLGIWLASVVYREMIAPLQRKLVESQAVIERQEKLASLGVLAAGVAHEIRNPLTAIKARLFTQQRALARGTPEFDDAVVIGNEINRLERIVKDVLLFARPAEPQLILITPEIPLREVRDLLAPQLEKTGVKLMIEDLTEARFQADPQQLKQVLINLVQNAAESIEGGGRVTLRARKGKTVLHAQERPVVILEVSDTGKGIPLQVQKRLFDPFFSTKEGGAGLGLSIAARIVEKHGGALEFQTTVNRGTTFAVVLPMSPETDHGG